MCGWMFLVCTIMHLQKQKLHHIVDFLVSCIREEFTLCIIQFINCYADITL